MTAYDSLILKGRQEEKFQATKNMILKGFSNEVICEVLNVSNGYVE